ncbi:MAG: Lrp/AsnC family transcriptional regulator [Caulobacteraceae bacterium]|nr:Lrp/AsnC family transcriptional regulator [Caulobacteraceae bacterium]
MSANSLDDYDRRLLAIVQEDASLSAEELGRRLNLSASAAWRRLKRLKDQGVITGEVARLDPERLGLGVTALVLIGLKVQAPDALEGLLGRLSRSAEVLEIAKLSGDADLMLKVRTADLAAYDRLLEELVLKAPEVATVRTSLVLKTHKATTALPLRFAP